MIENLNRLGQIWADFALLMVVQNTVFLMLIFLILYLFRNTAASVRYMICLTGLIKLLIPPFIPLTSQVSLTAAVNPFPINLLSGNPDILNHQQKTLLSSSNEVLTMEGLLFLIWIFAISIYLLYTVASFRQVVSRLKDAVPVHPKYLPGLKSSGKLKIYKSSAICLPVTTGFFSGRIFLPAGWTNWTAEFKQMVLRHERAHITRHDNLMQLLQIVMQALYFFHPLVYILNRRITTMREMACDDLAVAPNLCARVHFSKYLLEIAEAAVNNPYADDPASAFIRHKNGLSERINYQMKETGMYKLSRTKNGILIMALLILSMLFSFYLSANDGPVLISHEGHETISISINELNEISINGEQTSFANLNNALDEQIQGEKDRTVVIIEGEDNTNMEQILNIEKVLRNAGLFRIAYMNKLGLQLNLVLPPPGAEKNLDHIDPGNLLPIELMENGDVKFKGKKLTQGNTKEFLEKKLSENEFTIVRILTHTQTAYADFHHLLKQAKQAGAVRIIVDSF